MIFSLLRYRPKLRELIPKGFVDIHSHVLPGIDDGSKSIEESLEIIFKMNELGYSKIIATPHTYPNLYDNTNDSIKNSFKKISKEASKILKVSYSSEYLIDFSLIKKSKKKEILTLKDNFILVEMSYMSPPVKLREIIFKLQLYGYCPILAHPERYKFLYDDFEKFYMLKNIGCKFQINLSSATGQYGYEVIKITDKLLKNDLCDFVGSDVHNLKHLNNFEKKIRISELEKFKKCVKNTMLFG